MLSTNELQKLAPYLEKGKVVNMEIKDYPKTISRPALKEVLLEYDDGMKYIGNLNENPIHMRKLTGMSTIVSYFSRGFYGNNSWRGNFSGLLVKDLIEVFNPKLLIDPCVGGGTTFEVAKKMGVNNICLDLNPKWGGFDALTMELPAAPDLIIFHPCYFSPEGSSMPRYSSKEWGTEVHPSDGSWIKNETEFTKWFNKIQSNLYSSLRKGGRLAILMGSTRWRGSLYSMFKEMDIYGVLEHHVVKVQHNVMSDGREYKKTKFPYIPIMHEDLVIIRKDDNYIIPCKIVRNIPLDIRTTESVTWKTLIQNTAEALGGRFSKKQLKEILINHPKAKNNNHIDEKIRQVLNGFKMIFEKVTEDEYMLRPIGYSR